MIEDKKLAWPADLKLGPDGLGNSPEHIAKIMGHSMEGLIHHFKLVTEGIRVPAGQVYVAVESPRGELGVHMVSDGGTRPYRVHYRDPSFTNLQAVAAMCEGGMVADAIAAVASIDPVMGGVDRRALGEEPSIGTVFLGARPAARRARSPDPRARHAIPADVTSRLDADAAVIIARYPQSRSALLPLLHLVQSEDGYLTPAGIAFCASQLSLTHAEVTAVATFYSMYRRTPTGDYLVGVCTNTLCAIMGGDAILEALEEHLGVDAGQTTADGRRSPSSTSSATPPATTRRSSWSTGSSSTTRPRRRPAISSTPCARGDVTETDPRCVAVHVPRDRANPCGASEQRVRRRRITSRRGDAGRTAVSPTNTT